MMPGHLVMRLLLFGAVGLLLHIEGVTAGDPALWFAFLGMAVALMLGYDKGCNDAREQQRGGSVDNSENH
ncbi:hypothetical protein [Massilia sp. HP4]|uniref:hypothetical protein n=1 Tax=Massilia sp. HP4 TaxID=2562316 RepID=UPI0010BFAA79|nr:hypothetical protein [Massilia sp. HP4]